MKNFPYCVVCDADIRDRAVHAKHCLKCFSERRQFFKEGYQKKWRASEKCKKYQKQWRLDNKDF